MSEPTLEAYKKAYREIFIKDSKKGFKIHVIVYVVNNIVLAAINLLTDPSTLWCLGALFGWGLGIIAHYISGVMTAGKKLDGMEKSADALAGEGP